MRADLKRLHRVLSLRTSPRYFLQKPRRYGRVLLLGAALAIVLLALGLGFRWFKGQQIAPGKMLSERQLTHNACGKPSHLRSDLPRWQVCRVHRPERAPLKRNRNRRDP